MTAARLKGIGSAVLALVAVSSVWLYAQPARHAGPFLNTRVEPAYIVVGITTHVTFSTQITDRELKKRSVILLRLDQTGKPTDILGRLNDEGKNGDARASDGYYTLRTTFKEAQVGTVSFRIAARFKPGSWREPEPDDDDWDKELGALSNDRANRRARLLALLQRFGRYKFSDILLLTLDPFLLPPDPGEAGMQTLAGIDSNNNGVRDDIERYIALTYANSAKTRASLSQLAVVLQESLFESGLKTESIENATAAHRATECLYYVRQADAKTVAKALLARFLNTNIRTTAYLQYDQQLEREIFRARPLSQWKSSCAFDPDVLPN